MFCASPHSTEPTRKITIATCSTTLAAVEVAELAVERADDGRREQVRRDDPREVLEPAEVADDRRQRGRDDRLVERREQHDEHQRAEDQADARRLMPAARSRGLRHLLARAATRAGAGMRSATTNATASATAHDANAIVNPRSVGSPFDADRRGHDPGRHLAADRAADRAHDRVHPGRDAGLRRRRTASTIRFAIDANARPMPTPMTSIATIDLPAAASCANARMTNATHDTSAPTSSGTLRADGARQPARDGPASEHPDRRGQQEEPACVTDAPKPKPVDVGSSTNCGHEDERREHPEAEQERREVRLPHRRQPHHLHVDERLARPRTRPRPRRASSARRREAARACAATSSPSSSPR